jgi:hypothetical protein
MPKHTDSRASLRRPDFEAPTCQLAHEGLRLVGWMVVVCFRLYLWLVLACFRLPFWLLVALCGRHYVVRRNGRTSWVSVWRYW